MWKPVKKEKKAVKAVGKKAKKVVQETVKEKQPTERAENPFLFYNSNETLAVRCQNDLGQLFTRYDGRFKTVEAYQKFGDLVHDQYAESLFTYNPILVVIGEKGVGKTTFVNWILGWTHYPVIDLKAKKTSSGFKTTDHFMILEQDNIAPKIDGTRVVENDSKPFGSALKSYQPEINTTLILYSFKDSRVLRDITIIDTPAPTAKTVNQSGGRFISDVTETLCFLADRVYLLVDASKAAQSRSADSIISHETMQLSHLLIGDEKKVAIILTKCESLDAKQAAVLKHRVALCFSKLSESWLSPSVFIGTFLNADLPPGRDKDLVDHWHAEIFNDVCNMQRHKVLHVADALVLRGKQLVTLSFIVRLIVAKRTYFRKQLILKHLNKIFAAAQELCRRPFSEFPPIDIVHQRLTEVDISSLLLPSTSMLQDIEKMIYREIPEIVEDHMRKMRHLLDDVPYKPSFSLDLDKKL